MSKRKADFDNDDYGIRVPGDRLESLGDKKDAAKHTLDSDEEDLPDAKYDITRVEGQEDATFDAYDGIKITPFNLKEEEEEGHFDSSGFYVFKKNNEDIRDNWLDNIDWVKVKESDKKYGSDDESSSSEDAPLPGSDESMTLYKQLLEFLKPRETVAKAIRRLGGGKTLTASERWKQKKSGNSVQATGDREAVLKLTGLADKILSNFGNMDVYQETYESVSFKVKQAETKNKEAVSDMFGEDYEEEVNGKEKGNHDDDSATKSATGETLGEQVMWEYKLENKEDAPIQGPFSSSQMHEWSTSGRFEGDVWVRRIGQTSGFYSSRRIDFELYT